MMQLQKDILNKIGFFHQILEIVIFCEKCKMNCSLRKLPEQEHSLLPFLKFGAWCVILKYFFLILEDGAYLKLIVEFFKVSLFGRNCE